jgi:predicted phage terminase large subunit-like protein
VSEKIPIFKVREACEHSFAAFCHLVQEDGWMDPIHDDLCNWIQYHIDNMFPPGTDCNDPNLKGTLQLAIIMPRGSLKTTFCNRNLSAWLPIRFSTELRSLMVTNTHPNAKKKMEAIKGIFTDCPAVQAVFPELTPRPNDKWNSEISILPRNGNYEDGTFESAGVGTAKTGSHYNVIIEDDTLAPDSDEMKEDLTLPSYETMERAIGYHKAAHPLLVPKGVRIRIVVTTRWGEGDLINHLERKAEGWKFFNMPARRADGTLNFSMFYDDETLKSIERSIGPYMFSCLYLNKPLDPRLKTFKLADVVRATGELPPFGDMSYLTIACDPAISKAGDACDTVVSVAGHLTKGQHPHLFLYEALAGKYSMGETVEIIVRLFLKYGGIENVKAIIIENIAYQQALLERVVDRLRELGLPQPVIPFNSRSNKLDRIRNVLEPLFFSNRIHLASDLPKELFEQFNEFPNGKFVDIIDCISFHGKSMRLSAYPEKPLNSVPALSGWDLAMDEIKQRNKRDKAALRRTHAGNQFGSVPALYRESRLEGTASSIARNLLRN